MKRTINPDEAHRILSRVPDHVSFWLCTNQKLYSLRDLANALQAIEAETFRYHVNRDKNDFENWIRDVIQDRELAREIARIKTKETLTRKITDRVTRLSQALGPTTKKSAKGKKSAKKKVSKKKNSAK